MVAAASATVVLAEQVTGGRSSDPERTDQGRGTTRSIA
jgi:hypothetical protein